MPEFKVKRCRPLRLELRIPGDRDISHRAVIMAGLANGPCEISGFLPGEDCLRTVAALRSLGIVIEELETTKWGPTRLRVEGRRGILESPDGDLDCGDSGATLHLLAGGMAGQGEEFRARLIAGASLEECPLGGMIGVLGRMGARIRAEGPGETAPVVVQGTRLHAVDCHLPEPNPDTKGAILLAGLAAGDKTTVTGSAVDRDHTERMLRYFQVKTVRQEERLTIWGGQTLESRDFEVPGDVSCAACWVAVAAAMPGAHLCVQQVGLNQRRTGFLKVLIRMGAQITEVIDHSRCEEPVGRIEVHGGKLRGTSLEASEFREVIDEWPAIAVAAAVAAGTTVIRSDPAFRHGEAKRLAVVARHLRLMGVGVEEFPGGMEIRGGQGLRGARIESGGDPFVAMAFAAAGLLADGETIITDPACIRPVYPGFEEEIRAVLSPKYKGTYTPVINSLHPPAGKDT